jgi:hypothetical protein
MSVWYYEDANGIQHESYEAACRYYGADTPAQIAAEAAAEYEEWLDHCAEYDLFFSWVSSDVDTDCIPF